MSEWVSGAVPGCSGLGQDKERDWQAGAWEHEHAGMTGKAFLNDVK